MTTSKPVSRVSMGNDVSYKDLPLTYENVIAVSKVGETVNGEERSRIPVSEVLERMDDSAKYKGDKLEGTDAFQRQLYRLGIQTKSGYGKPASKMRAFVKNSVDQAGAMLLFPEFLSRTWHSVSYQADKAMFDHMQSEGRIGSDIEYRFYQSNVPISDILFPDRLSLAIRQKQIAPTMPLSLLVARTEPLDTVVGYTAFRLTDDKGERTLKRRAEGTELPTVKLTGADVTYKPLKYGVALEASYESILSQRVDRFAFHLALLAAGVEVDKVSTAIDILINGDGSASSAATNTNISSLDSSWVSGVTAAGYLQWRMLWLSPYNCNVIVARNAGAVELLLANTGSANSLMQMLWGTPGQIQFVQDKFTNVQVGVDNTWAPANKLLGLDNRFALEQIVVTGMDLVETDKLIKSQTDVITFSEMLTFDILDINGVVRTLDYTA